MRPPPSADAAAVEESLQQPEAFAHLYDRYAADIHRYVTRRLGAEAADDVTSETFLVAFRTRRRFHASAASARPWLYGIAAKPIGRQRRSELRMLKAYTRTGWDPVMESWAEHADSRVVAQGMHRELAGALAGLSAGDRHVLLLVAWAEFSYQEVADALEIPLGTVRSRLNRARRKIRTALGADPALAIDAMEVA
ncbi:RNA polymerase sigma factor [Streptomyces olivochromogenes]|uniref:RNA polymerase sigma factor n=1 Tax=Streptomyces olivochromogenes TaxID=1963 RepID=UPI0036D9D565